MHSCLCSDRATNAKAHAYKIEACLHASEQSFSKIFRNGVVHQPMYFCHALKAHLPRSCQVFAVGCATTYGLLSHDGSPYTPSAYGLHFKTRKKPRNSAHDLDHHSLLVPNLCFTTRISRACSEQWRANCTCVFSSAWSIQAWAGLATGRMFMKTFFQIASNCISRPCTPGVSIESEK